MGFYDDYKANAPSGKKPSKTPAPVKSTAPKPDDRRFGIIEKADTPMEQLRTRGIREARMAGSGFVEGLTGFRIEGPQYQPGYDYERYTKDLARLGGVATGVATGEAGAAMAGRAVSRLAPRVAVQTPKLLKSALQGGTSFGIFEALHVPDEGESYTGNIMKSAGFGAALPLGLEGVRKAIGVPLKKFFPNLFYTRGRPDEYIKDLEATENAIQNGYDKAIEVGRSLAQNLTPAEQVYANRLMRGRVDLSGKGSNIHLLNNPAESHRLQREIQLNLGSSPRIKALNAAIADVNKKLRNELERLKGKIGTQFQSPSGVIEEVTDVTRVPNPPERMTKAGKPFRGRLQLKTDPVSSPEVRPFVEDLGARSNKQIAGSRTLKKTFSQQRRDWMVQRRQLVEQLRMETEAVIKNTRAGYQPDTSELTKRIMAHPKFEKIAAVTNPATAELTRLGWEAVQAGLLKESIYRENLGKYVPQMYLSQEQKKIITNFLGTKPNKLKLQRFMARKDIPEEVKIAMGQIDRPAYPVSKGMMQITKDVELAKLYERIAANPAYSQKFGTKGATPEGMRLLQGKKYGALDNMYVANSIADDIDAIHRIPSEGEILWERALSIWKGLKTLPPFSIATSVGNTLSNMFMQEVSGGPGFASQANFLRKFIADMASNGYESTMFAQASRELKAMGKLGKDFYNVELQNFLTNLPGAMTGEQKLLSFLGRGWEASGKFYGAQDQYFKVQRYLWDLQRGLPKHVAAANAEKFFFDYSKVPNWVKAVRKSPVGVPFLTYAVKAGPALWEAAARNPLKVFKYKLLWDTWNDASTRSLGVDRDVLQELMPAHLRGRATLVMPTKDADGNIVVVDFSNALPFIGSFASTAITNPERLASMSPVVQSLGQIATGHDVFGREILPPQPTATERLKAYGGVVGNVLAPQIAKTAFVDVPDQLRRPLNPDFSKKYPGDKALQTLTGVRIVRINPTKGLRLAGQDLAERKSFDKAAALDEFISTRTRSTGKLIKFLETYPEDSATLGEDLLDRFKRQTRIPHSNQLLLLRRFQEIKNRRAKR